MATFTSVSLELLKGFGVTLEIFVLTLVFSIPLGLMICFGSMSRFRVIQAPIRLIIWVIRGTPLMLQLIAVFFVPGLVFHTNGLGRMEATLVAFSVNYACYFSEIYRGGIESIPRGQYEAGRALGMSRSQIFFHVILIQVIKRIVPPMANEIITLVKDTALARTISVYELMWSGQAFIKSAGIVWPLFYTGAFYLLFSGLLTLTFGRVESRLNYYTD